MCSANADKVLVSPLKIDNKMIAEAVYPLPKNTYNVSDEVFFTYTNMNSHNLESNSKLIRSIPKSKRPQFDDTFKALAKLDQEKLQTYNLSRLGDLMDMKKNVDEALKKNSNIQIKGLHSLKFLAPKRRSTKQI
jgi:hypothetical protein